MLQKIEAVALRLDQLGMWMCAAKVSLTSKPPAAEYSLSKFAGVDGFLGTTHGFGVPVIEVDREK